MCTNNLKRYALNGATMGTRFSAIFYAPKDVNIGHLQGELQTAVQAVDEQMSPWNPASELSKFNHCAIGAEVKLPKEFATVLAAAQNISSASGGAFNICVGDLINAWGFGPNSSQPDGALIAATAANGRAVNNAIQFSPKTRMARRANNEQIDLCGIAKGYGVDRLGDVLAAEGIANFLISIDGEMKASGEKPDGSAWIVGIENPDTEARTLACTLALNNLSIASSGNYRHRVVHSECVYSHTMDPSTNAPVENGLTAVTVVADDCMSADAWATALMVMGEDAGPKFATEHGLSAWFFSGHGADASVIQTGVLSKS